MKLSQISVAEGAFSSNSIRVNSTSQKRWLTLLACCCTGAVFACGLASAVAAAPLAWRGWAYLALHGLLSLLMLAAWLSLHQLRLYQAECVAAAPVMPDTRLKLPPPLAQGLLWVLIAGVLCRLLLLEVPAFTTHDVQRYLWDGAVALSGLDPYRVAPDSAAALPLRRFWPTPGEHAAYPTLYPPAALALFSFSALAGPIAGLWLWKALVTAASITTLLIAYRWLVRRGTAQYLPLLALSPLLLLETGIGAHVDGFSALAVVAALSAFEAGRRGRVGVWIGLGALVKLLPLVLLLPLCVAASARREWRKAGVIASTAVATLGLGYGLALLLHLQPIGSIGLLFQRWRFGSPLYAGLEASFSAPVAAYLAMAALLILLLLCAWRAWANRGSDIASAVQLALAAPLLVSPVTFPWYLCALLPAILMRPRWALLVWLSVAPLTYEVLNAFDSTGVWAPALWPLWVIATCVAVALLADVFGLDRRGPGHRGSFGPPSHWHSWH